MVKYLRFGVHPYFLKDIIKTINFKNPVTLFDKNSSYHAMTLTNFIKPIFIIAILFIFNKNSKAQCGAIELVSDNYTLCQPAQFKWVLKNVPSGSSVLWDFGHGKQNGNDTFYAFIDNPGKISLIIKINLQNGGYCEFNKTDFVEVYPVPIPVLNISRKLLCDGADSVTLTDLTMGSVKRTWATDGLYYYNTQAKFYHTYKSVGIKKISMVVEDNKGCIGIKEFDTAIVIYNKPVIDFSADITSGCINNTVKFIPKINTFGISIDSFIWNFPGGQPFKQLSQNPLNVNYFTSGIFSPSLEIKTSNGCDYRVIKPNFQSYGNPVILSLKLSDTSVCIGKTITIENLDKTLLGTLNWTISGTSNLIQPDKYTNYATYNAIGTYDVSLNYNHNGCLASHSLINVIRVKDVTAGFVSTDNYHCKLPHTIHFTNLSKSSDPGSIFYNWEIFENSTLVHFSNSVNDSFKLTNAGLFSVTLTATHSNGCIDSFSSNHYISNKKIAPEFDAAFKVGCVNQSIQFIQKTPASSYQALNHYKWIFYDKDTTNILGYSTNSNPSFSYAAAGIYKVKMIADNGVGCKDSLQKDNFIEIVKPIIHFDLVQNIICKNDILHAIGNSSPSNANFRYFWYLKNKLDGTEIYKESATFNELLNKAGQYDFKFVHQINTGCRDSIVNNQLLNANGINAEMHVDTTNGCLPFTVKPNIKISENVHFGSLSNTILYKWTASPNSGVTINYDTTNHPEYIFTTAGEYQIESEIVNSLACSQKIISKIIYAGIKADFTISDATVCFNQTIQLKNNSYLKPSGIHWILNLNTFSNDPLDNSEINAKFPVAGFQTIGLAIHKFNTCFDTIYKTIQSIEVKAEFDALQTVMKCAPVYAKFISHSTNADSLIWNFGDGTKISSSVPLVGNIYKKNTDSEKGYTISLIAKSKEGCSDTVTKPNYMKIIGPVPDFSLQNFVGCTPLNVKIIDKSINIFKYYISYGDNTANDSVAGNHTYTISNPNLDFETYLPKLYSVDILGCVAAFESKDTIVVNANPKARFILNDTIVCANETIKIINKTVNVTNSDFYIFDGLGKTLLKSDSLKLDKKGNYQLSLIVKNFRKCTDTAILKIKVNPNPIANFILTDTLCLLKPVNFKNLSTSEFPLIAYNWKIKNPLTPVLFNTNNCKHSFNNIGIASVVLAITDQNGCQSSLLQNLSISDPASIPIEPLKMVSVNLDNSVNIVSYPTNYYRYIVSNFFFKNNLIYTSTSKSEIQFNNLLPANYDSICIDRSISDVCGYESLTSNKHCTIFLKVISNKAFTNQLIWTPYIGWPAITNYLVYRKKQNDINYSLIKTLPSKTYIWLDSGLCNIEYSYYIVANYNDLSSTSNTSKSSPQFIYPTTYSNINNVSVLNSNAIQIRWEASSNSIFNYYTLYRTCIESSKTISIKLPYNSYIDSKVSTDQHTYLYKLTETDLCENSSESFRKGKSILLTGTSNDYKSNLNWNTYKSWKSGVKSYSIQIEKDNQFSTIYSATNSDSIFQHSQQSEIIHGPYCYRILAISGDGIDSSYSNITCLISPSTLYFANAFSPNSDGINDKIGAKSLFVYNHTAILGRNFSLRIYNLYGEIVFESINLDEEWDGMYKGKMVQEGVYIYHLKALGADYRSYYIKGLITIIR